MLDGIVLLDKPSGISSNRALRQVQKRLGARKAGHTGTLDPLATGMLPLCFGEATKLAPYLIDSQKCYTATLALGSSTATGDAEGEVIASMPVPEFDRATIEEKVRGLLGPSLQIPPMYSALKRNGVALYELARRGEVVERAARPINVVEAGLIEVELATLTFRVVVSKGTYIRVLGEKLAAAIGTLGHLSALRRDWVNPFQSLAMVAFDEVLKDQPIELITASQALKGMPSFDVDANLLRRLMQGLPTQLSPQEILGVCRITLSDGAIHGIARIDENSLLKAERIFLRPI